jgi:putative flippase GtrA
MEPTRRPLDRAILAIAGRFGSKAKEVERFLKFLVVGLIGFVVDLGTLIVLQGTLLPPVNTVNVAVATTIAFCAAILSNFIWNRFWTYPDSRSRSVRRQLFQFAFISVIGWLGRTLWISLAYAPLGDLLLPLALPVIQTVNPGYTAGAATAGRIGSVVAQIIGVAVVMFWNFFANRYWTYSDVES